MMKKKEHSENNGSPIEQYFESNNVSTKEVKKNQILQMPGTIASKAYYVKSGLLRSYSIDDNGKVHIFMFAPEGWMVSDIESHIMSVPSELFIDAMEDSEIYEVNQVPIEIQKVNNSENTAMLFRRIAVLQKRVLLLMSASAKQRYQHFIETYPQLTNRVSRSKMRKQKK